VYSAFLWPLTDKLLYAYAGINLYTNYDGKGGTFGDTLVSSFTNNKEFSSAYASTDKDGSLHIILLNKSQHNVERFSLVIQSGFAYNTYDCYGFNSDSPAIKDIGSGTVGENNTLICELPPLSAYHLVLRK